jgi:eukaryotic-like serine/threonine-protein kinase
MILAASIVRYMERDMTVSAGASNDGPAPGEFARARTVFESALEQPPAERVQFVERTCRGDARLAAAVQAMLDADAKPHPLLDSAPVLQVDRWQAGDVFGRFRIVALLGRGGMGEVYRAHDATLGRDVALKFLPPVLGDDNLDDGLARFQREAQVLAALNHPNIAAIHGIEDANGARALVLEFVDGPTLAEQIATGSLPLEDALAIARQIAIGLEAAHEQGIIHRDLKPTNIKRRPDGTVKLLDFGLAKVTNPEIVRDGIPVSTPATITTPSFARHGVVLGTAAYASPEQAKGREADKRSDVWSFGAVVYEMLSGERAFKGEETADALAAVLRADIEWSRIPKSTPASLRHLLSRCLERDASRRLRDIGEARILLDDLIRGGASAMSTWERTATTMTAWRRVVPLAAAALAGAAVVTAILWRPQSARTGAPLRFALSTPVSQALLLDPQSRDLGLTPDGSAVVYKGGPRADRSQLFVHSFDQLEARPLTASGQPKSPIVSPDGQWVVFFEPGGGAGGLGAYVKKVAIGGGPTLNVSRLDGPSRGATWGADGAIIAASGASATGLLKIAASGGETVVLTRPNRERGEWDHLWPHALPGGKTILFTITALDGGMDAAQVAALDVASGTWKTLVPGASQAQYVSSGHLVYVAGGALWAIAFDPSRVETLGAATVVVPEIVTLSNGTAEFDVARDGTLIYVARGGASVQPRTFVWVDRDGREFPVKGVPPRPYVNVRLSPDETRVATEIADQDHDLWVWDFAREALTKVTNDPGLDESPAWTPDGRRLIFTSQANGVLGSLFIQAADGSGTPESLAQSNAIQRATSVLRDGSRVIFTQPNGIMTLGLNQDRKVETLLHTERGVSMEGDVSPDGRWLAYTNVESGSPQIVVIELANPSGERTQVTSNGGSQPRWAANGRELFYTSLDGTIMGVGVTTATRFSAGVPTTILGRTYYVGRGVLSRGGTYDVAADGRRFLMLKQAGDPSQLNEPPRVVVVKNWGEELKRLLPRRR